MADIIETSRARMVRLVAECVADDKVALASSQALADLLIGKGIISSTEFYNAVSARLEDK